MAVKLTKTVKTSNQLAGFSRLSSQAAGKKTLRLGGRLGGLNFILTGLAFSALRQASAQTGFAIKDIQQTIGMSERTYERRRSAGKLTTDESDRLARLLRLFDMSRGIFADNAAAGAWFKRPRAAFDGMTPLEMAKTETGGRQVEQLLGNLAQGVLY